MRGPRNLSEAGENITRRTMEWWAEIEKIKLPDRGKTPNVVVV